MRYLAYLALTAALGLGFGVPARSQGVTFDFDTGSPALSAGQGTPFDQAASGLSAHFSSAVEPAFSLQTDSSTGFRMLQFSGKYLYANHFGNALDIKFNQPITSITLTFATADFQQMEVPTSLRAVAFVDSTASAPVGSATAHGTYGSSTMPMGQLTFSSGNQPFNLVEIGIPPGQPLAASAFLVDNIVVTVASTGNFPSMSAATRVAGGELAPGSIVMGAGQALTSVSESALTLPLPTILANTTVAVKDSAGVERAAPLFFAGPTQINYQIPEGTAAGLATLTVSNGPQIVAQQSVVIAAAAPGIFTANFDGKGVVAGQAVSVAPDWSQTMLDVAQCGATPGSCVSTPIDLGPSGTFVVLVLYGTGIRGVSSPAGVTAAIGGLDSPVLYAGPQNQFVGLDQVNILIPPALAGRGEVDLALTVDGKPANTARVNIR